MNELGRLSSQGPEACVHAQGLWSGAMNESLRGLQC
ncbi:hypothetical protein DFR68_108175 [Nocardia mexicana]|uniref:Uncharacterized protein n=1 Tax=Nocardia mexicana TaxID=279262 RepID=A0A370H098_9NOCA|nr:hypothetical protein DFR68_108175 [Nocardia mexicana]